jgi:hypothetical protein
VVRRVRDEFGYADANREAGADHVGDMIAHYVRVKARYARWKNPPPDAAELDGEISRLEGIRQDAIMLTFGDDPASEYAYVSLAILPEEPLFIAYCSRQHEEEASPLVRRIASILSYQVALE